MDSTDLDSLEAHAQLIRASVQKGETVYSREYIQRWAARLGYDPAGREERAAQAMYESSCGPGGLTIVSGTIILDPEAGSSGTLTVE